MRKFIVECWDGVMSHDYNPLKHIPDLQVRHMILQILAWLWCIVFSLYIGSWVVLGLTFAAHFLLIAAIVVDITSEANDNSVEVKNLKEKLRELETKLQDQEIKTQRSRIRGDDVQRQGTRHRNRCRRINDSSR